MLELANHTTDQEARVAHLFQRPLVPFANLLLLVSLHLFVVEVLGGTFNVVEAELGMLLRFASVIGQMANSPRSVWLAVLQPGKQLRRSLEYVVETGRETGRVLRCGRGP